VLGYDALEVGLSFLPANIVMAICSVSVSARLVMRFGFRVPLLTGLAMAAVGLLLFARAPVDGSFTIDVLPSMILLGFGAGIAFNPVLMAAMSDVSHEDSGLASGLVNTSFMMGGALGLAVLASIAAATSGDAAAGDPAALLDGYHRAFLVGGLLAGLAAVIGGIWIGGRLPEPDGDGIWDATPEAEALACS
jgi:fucose permease